MVTDVFGLLLHVAQILDELDIRYVVGGSVASSMHGELRATNDVDILVDLPIHKVGALVAALAPTFDIPEDTFRGAVQAGSSFSALHVEWLVKVDFLPAGRTALDRSQLARRLSLRLPAAPEREIRLTSPEDMVVRKLDWFRRSNGVLERQRRDVVGILKLQGTHLDLGYLRKLVREVDAEELLGRCLEEAGLTGA